MMTTDDELDLVETTRLLTTLARRFDCVVVGTVENLNSQEECRGFTWSGGFTTAMGLVTFMDKRFAAMVTSTPVAGAEEDQDGG